MTSQADVYSYLPCFIGQEGLQNHVDASRSAIRHKYIIRIGRNSSVSGFNERGNVLSKVQVTLRMTIRAGALVVHGHVLDLLGSLNHILWKDVMCLWMVNTQFIWHIAQGHNLSWPMKRFLAHGMWISHICVKNMINLRMRRWIGFDLVLQASRRSDYLTADGILHVSESL